MSDLKHDPVAAASYLRAFHPGRAWNLSAIVVERKGMETLTFREGQESELAAWLERHAADNIYYGVPELSRDVSKKASKEDVAAVHWLHVDVDPRAGEDLAAERERILALLHGYTPPPTAIVFSGGGYQAFWRLSTPLRVDGDKTKAEEVERYNRQLEVDLDGDHCHSVDHVMRLPGSVNWPDARKRKKGRTPTRSELLEWHEERTYAATDLRKAHALEAATPVEEAPAAPAGPVASLDELPVDDRAKEIISTGRCAADGPKKKDDSRSAWLFDAVCSMVKAGCGEAVIVSVITDPRFKVSESVLEKGRRSQRYARDQFRRARDRCMDLVKSEKGQVLDCQENVRRSLMQMGATVEYDEFSGRMLVSGLAGFGPYIDDAAVNYMRLRAEEAHHLRVAKDRYTDIVMNVARSYPRHPVREYLDSLEWDGKARAEAWLPTYAGGADTLYARAIGTIFLVAAVRRIRRPGCKFDEMLVLEGLQGSLKSTLLSVLAVRDEWFSDDLPLGRDTKEMMEATSGKWIVEASELHGMGRGDVEALKAYLSRGTDRARLAYGRLTTEVPRHFVVVGTTNHERYLKDSTGNRRFWPYRTGEVDVEELRRDRDQLWAEASVLEASGYSTRLPKALWSVAAEEQEGRRNEEVFLHRLSDVLGDKAGVMSAEDVWTIVGVLPGNRNGTHNERVGAAMKEMGWIRTKRRLQKGHPPRWCYVKGDETEKLVVTIGRDGPEVVADKDVPF